VFREGIGQYFERISLWPIGSTKNDKVYSEIIEASAETYYGKGYQDIYSRNRNIEKARKLLGWEPVIGLDDALRMTLDSFLEENRGAV